MNVNQFQNVKVIALLNSDNNDIKSLKDSFDISSKDIKKLINPKEHPWLTFKKNKLLLTVPSVSENKESNRTITTLSFLIKDSNIIISCHEKNSIITKFLKQDINEKYTSVWDVLLNIFTDIGIIFTEKIESINLKRETIQNKISTNQIKQGQIETLLKIQESYAYILTAVNDMIMILKNIEMLSTGELVKINMNSVELEILSDTIQTFQQLEKTVNLMSDITDKVANTFNNLLNNQTNKTMKILTIYSIALSIPTIVSGFYGMNMFLPFVEGKYSWLFSIVLTFLIILIVMHDLHNRKFF